MPQPLKDLRVAQRDLVPIHITGYALAGHRLEILGLGQLNAFLLCTAHDRLSQRMFAAPLQACSQPQALVLLDTVRPFLQ